MTRKIMAILVALLMGVVALTVGTALADSAPKEITLTGTLTYTTELESPHYLLQGYVVINSNISELQALTNQEVTVTGTELLPTIYMTKMLLVSKITPRRVTPPVGGVPIPGSGGTVVTIPEMPPKGDRDPMPPIRGDGGGTVTIPAFPAPLKGAPHFVLYGQLEIRDGLFFLKQHTNTFTWVTSDTVDLSPYIGHQVGVLAQRKLIAAGRFQYQVIALVQVHTDLADRINSGVGAIYLAPKGEISIRLRGRFVQMNHAPIIGNGHALVGLRAIAEAMGAQVTWNQETRTATVMLDDRQVSVTIGSDQVNIQRTGQTATAIQADVAPVIVNGRTMVPARLLSESLGLKVSWDESTRTIDLQ